MLLSKRGSPALLSAAFPLIAISELAVTSSPLRLLAVALILFCAVVLFVHAESNQGRLSEGSAAALVFLLLLIRIIPLSGSLRWSELIVAVTSVILVLALRDDLGVPLHAVAVTVLIGYGIAASHLRLAVVPLLLAASVAALRSSSLPFAAVAAVLAIGAGKWSWPLVTIVALSAFLVPKFRSRELMIAPWFSGAVASSVLLLVPIAEGAVLASRARKFAALLAVVAGLLMPRPYLTLLYLLAAVVIVLIDVPPTRWSMVGVVATLVPFLGWHGALPAVLPLPAVHQAAGAVAVMLAILAWWRIALPIGSIVAAVVFFAVPRALPPLISDGTSLPGIGRGEQVAVNFEEPSRRFGVALSGANISELSGDVVVGDIEFIDVTGAGARRRIVLRELADWGALRPSHIFSSRNSVPVIPAGSIAGVGADSYLRGTGLIAISASRPVRVVRVIAAEGLPSGAQLIVERIDPIP